MKNKGTLGLLAVVVLLSAYTYFVEYKGKENEKTTKEQQSVVLKDIKADQVNLVEINNLQQKIVLTRTPGGWEIVEPIKDSADSSEIESLIVQLLDEKSLSIATEGNEIKWANFGFDKPVKSIMIKTTSNQQKTVEVSEQKNFENNSFLRIPGENRVLVVSPSWSTNADKKVFDVRNKQIFRHQVSNVQQVQIKNKNGVTIIENKDAKWITSKQPDLPLDQNGIREMIAKINEIRSIEFVGEKDGVEAQKKNLKLGASAISLQVKLTEGTWNAQIYKGKDSFVYAEVPSIQLLVKIGVENFDRLSEVTLEGLRDFKLPFAAFDKAKVEKLSYETSLKRASLIKKGTVWELDPADPVNEVQQDKVTALMEVLRNLAATSYVTAKDVKKDFSKQRLTFKDAADAIHFQLQFSDSEKRKVHNEEKTIRYAKTNLYTDVFLLDETEFEKLGLNDVIKIKVNGEGKSLPVDNKKEEKHAK